MGRADWRAIGTTLVTSAVVSVGWLSLVMVLDSGTFSLSQAAGRFWIPLLLTFVLPQVVLLVGNRRAAGQRDDLMTALERLTRGERWVRLEPGGSQGERRLAQLFNRLAEHIETTQHDIKRSILELENGLTGKARHLEQANRVLLDVANRDPLTQLANRARLEIEIERHVLLARKSGLPLGVVMLDLDHFKAYNDAAGHLAGDQLLIRVADAMRSRTRATDLISRWGGDEFCVLLPGTTTRGTRTMVQGLVDAVTEAMNADLPAGLAVALGASAGIACFPDDATDAATLVALADRALYLAKASGRGCVIRTGEAQAELLPGETCG